jgi:hypothetical protein
MQVDGPICAALLVLFVLSAGVHFFLFQRNKRRGHFFIFSSMLFGFSLMRTGGLAMRLLWAVNLDNVQILMAANILAQAGSIIVFVVNLFLTQRIVRGYHADFGWSTTARVVFRFLVFCVLSCLVMLIAGTTQSFYTLDETIRAQDHLVQLFAGTLLTVLAFLPVPVVIISALVPRRYRIEKFGQGSWRSKILLLSFASVLLSLGAGFRVGVNYGPRPVADPAWYHGRTPFYIFNFVLDLIMSFTYIGFEFYNRFYIPDGAKGPGSYMAGDQVKDLTPPASRSPSPSHKRESAPAPTIPMHRAWPSSHDASSITRPKSVLKRFSASTARNDPRTPADPISPVYYAQGLPRYRDFESPVVTRTSSNASNASGATSTSTETTDVEDNRGRRVGGVRAGFVLANMLEKIQQEAEQLGNNQWGGEWTTRTAAGSRATTMVGGSSSESEGEATNSDGERRNGRKKQGPRIKWAE